MPDKFEALSQLVEALKDFLDSGLQSEGSGNTDDPHGGMEPSDLACESVDKGGEIHNVVCSLQPFYGGKLPAPEARNLWLELQRACRHETDPFKRQIDAHKYAGQLRDWAESEIKRGKGGRPTRRKRPTLVGKPLTEKQTEAVQIVGECKGDIAEAARRLGRDRSTIAQHYKAGMAKLGKTAVKHSTRALPTDRRGQANLSEGDDRRR